MGSKVLTPSTSRSKTNPSSCFEITDTAGTWHTRCNHEAASESLGNHLAPAARHKSGYSSQVWPIYKLLGTEVVLTHAATSVCWCSESTRQMPGLQPLVTSHQHFGKHSSCPKTVSFLWNRYLSQRCCHCSLCFLTLLWRHSATETRCFLGSFFLYAPAHASWPSMFISECFICLTWWPSSCSLTPFSKAQSSGSCQEATQRSGEMAKSVADFKDYSEDYHPEKLFPYRVITLGLTSWYFDPSTLFCLGPPEVQDSQFTPS